MVQMNLHCKAISVSFVQIENIAEYTVQKVKAPKGVEVWGLLGGRDSQLFNPGERHVHPARNSSITSRVMLCNELGMRI